MVFLATTLDSTTYTIAAYSSTDDMSEKEPSKNLRLFIAAIIAAIALIFMRIGGLPPLQVVSGILGRPIVFIQVISIIAAIKMMNENKAWINNVRK